MLQWQAGGSFAHLWVSILTRPESRMLQSWKAVLLAPGKVSILTRPESRMLPFSHLARWDSTVLFQSSPGPKAGCYVEHLKALITYLEVSILTRPESRMLHQPDPATMQEN